MDKSVEVHVRRSKLRRIFVQEFSKINKSIAIACKKQGINIFFIKYSQHLLDRAIQREIDENYIFELFNKLHLHVKEVNDFLIMEPLPDVEHKIIPNKEYRPLRLEITDGNLWVGMTVAVKDDTLNDSAYCLNARMAIENNKRHEGKISTKVIKL